MEKFDLSVIVNQYPQALSSRAKLASVLHDLYPTEKYLTNIALAAYETGVVERFRTAGVVDAMLTGSLIRQLESDYGMTSESAKQAIQLWGIAYGKVCSLALPRYTAQPKRALKAKNNSVVNHEMKQSILYDNNGIFIKYRGVVEKSSGSWIINLYIKNNYGMDIRVVLWNGCVNGATINMYNIDAKITDGHMFLAKPNNNYIIEQADLAEYDISKIESLYFELTIYPKDSWDEIERVPITLEL